jgi:hypothetical protein
MCNMKKNLNDFFAYNDFQLLWFFWWIKITELGNHDKQQKNINSSLNFWENILQKSLKNAEYVWFIQVKLPEISFIGIIFKVWLLRIPFYSASSLDRFHCTCKCDLKKLFKKCQE